MPTPIPSPFLSAVNWLRASHLRLLISGIVAVGVIASASIFAAEDNTFKDEISVYSPELNQPVTADFPFRVDWKPKQGRTIWSARAYIDNHRVATWDYNKLGQPANGKAKWQYPFRWGLGSDGKANDRFNRNLLQPGTHTMKILLCSNNNPMASCLLIKQLEQTFTVTGNDAVTTFQEGPIAIDDLSDGNPVTGRGDGRIKRGMAAPAAATSAVKAATQDAPDLQVKTDKTEPQEEFEVDNLSIEKTSFDSLLFGKAYATKSVTVQVNPIGLTPGHVEVEVVGPGGVHNCSPSRKPIPPGGVVTFGGCAETNHSAIAHPGAFKNGNQNCNATVQSAPANNSAQLHYHCVPDQPPPPPPPPPGGDHTGHDHGTLVVFVNPHPRLKNVPVTTNGYCHEPNQKTAGKDGRMEWRCTAGKGKFIKVRAPKIVTPAEHQNERWIVLSEERDFQIAKDDTKAVNFNYSLQAYVDPGGNPVPVDAFQNNKPMLALRSLSCTEAKVDAYKVLSVSNASPAKTSGYLAGYTVNVDGQQVTNIEFPPGTWQDTVPIYTPAPQNWLPTYRENLLPVGNLCDGKKHSVVLTAKTLDGHASSIVISEVGSKPDVQPPAPGKGTINALVYNDKDGDGQQDEGEAGVPDVTVTSRVQPRILNDPNAEGEQTDPNRPDTINPPDEGTDDDNQVKLPTFTQKTNELGIAIFKDLPNSNYRVAPTAPGGFKVTTKASRDVMVKDNTPSVSFGIQQLQTESPAPEPAPEPTDEPAGPRPPSDFNPAAPDQDIQPQTGGAGALPKTGQIGLIAFITFLLASATYYGTQYYREHKQQ